MEEDEEEVLSDLENLDEKELRLMCFERHLSIEGDKNDFLIRLKSYFGFQNESTTSETVTTQEQGKYMFWNPRSIKNFASYITMNQTCCQKQHLLAKICKEFIRTL